MTLFRSLIALAVALLIFPACDSTEQYSIGGTYSGISNEQAGLEADLSLTIPATASGSSFTFSGELTQSGQPTALSGTGTYDHPAIALDVSGDAVTGTVSDDGDLLEQREEAGGVMDGSV